MKMLIASDHGGFELKEHLEYAFDIDESQEGFESIDIQDLGPHALNPEDDYPEFAFMLARQLLEANKQEDQNILGLLVCRSGNGMAIAANKVKGIRAAFCISPEHARKAREHNHANVLVLDADYSPNEQAADIVRAFVESKPQAGRHERRVGQITAYEQS